MPREAWGTTPLNLDLSRLHVTTPDHHEMTSPMLLITLPLLPEKVVAERAPMAEQVALEEVAPEEVEMGEEEELDE